MQNIEDMEFYPAALTITGSDSGGGAGIQADLRTFNAFGIYGCSAVTAVISRNPFHVRRTDVLPPEVVRSQINAVLDAIPVRIAKTGMLANSAVTEAVASAVSDYSLPLVVNPSIVEASGVQSVEKSAIETMKKCLLPLAAWVTPDIPEMELILERKLEGKKDFAEAVRRFYDRFGSNVLLRTGSSAGGKAATDYLCCDGKCYTLSSPAAKVPGTTTHGVGCTISAAIAAGLAFGMNWEMALTEAKSFVYGSLCETVHLSGNLTQMYPPSEDSLKFIRLEPLREK